MGDAIVLWLNKKPAFFSLDNFYFTSSVVPLLSSSLKNNSTAKKISLFYTAIQESIKFMLTISIIPPLSSIIIDTLLYGIRLIYQFYKIIYPNYTKEETAVTPSPAKKYPLSKTQAPKSPSKHKAPSSSSSSSSSSNTNTRAKRKFNYDNVGSFYEVPSYKPSLTSRATHAVKPVFSSKNPLSDDSKQKIKNILLNANAEIALTETQIPQNVKTEVQDLFKQVTSESEQIKNPLLFFNYIVSDEQLSKQYVSLYTSWGYRNSKTAFFAGLLDSCDYRKEYIEKYKESFISSLKEEYRDIFRNILINQNWGDLFKQFSSYCILIHQIQ